MTYRPREGIEETVKDLVQLTELEDVNITTPQSNQSLAYDNISGDWVNKDLARLIDNSDIQSVLFTADDYTVGETINVTVVFNKAVTVINNPQINTTADSGTIIFDYDNQPQSDRIIFSYTVQSGDSELASLQINFIDYTNGEIRESATPNVDLNVDFYTGITIGGGSPILNDWYNVRGTTNAIIVSFANSNQISLNGVLQTTASEGQIVTISSVSSGDRISSTGGVVVWGENPSATSTWIPSNFAGRSFVQWLDRNDPQTVYIKTFSNSATVQCFSNGALQFTLNVPANSNVSQNFSGITGTAFSVISDQDILVHITSNNGAIDSRPMFPATLELYGIPSGSADLVALNTGTVTLTNSADNFTSYQVGPSGGISINGSSNYSGPGVKLTSDVPIGVTSTADSDGTEATVWLPRTMMGKTFFLPMDCEFVSFVSADDDVDIDVFAPTNYTTPLTTISTSGAIVGGPHFEKYQPTGLIPAGTKFVATGDCYAVAEEGTDEETILLGLK